VRRRLLTLVGFATGVVAGTVLYRRTGLRRRERVDLYFDDGSMLSLGDGSPAADRLLPLGRQILETARRSG
jgi:hypothetical protein